VKIERVISWFDRNTEELIGEHSVNSISLKSLKRIFSTSDSDPLMYNPYDIDVEKGKELSLLTGFEFNHEKYVYQIDCFQA